MSPSRKIKIGSKNKIGFVCSGGATKAGAFHLGVALALREKGFQFKGGLEKNLTAASSSPKPMEISCYVGSSAGSIISTYLASGYSLENIFNSFADKKPDSLKDSTPRILPRLSYPTMFHLRKDLLKEQLSQLSLIKTISSAVINGDFEALLQLKWLKTTGFFSTKGIEKFLSEQVLESNSFSELSPDLFIIATELNTARKVIFGKKAHEAPDYDRSCIYRTDAPISKACAASTCLPIVYAPYLLETDSQKETYFIDGELRDTLSSHVAVDAGCDLIFASYTHQPYSIKEGISSLTKHGLPAILVQSAYLVIEQKIRQYIYHKDLQRNAIREVERFCKKSGIDSNIQKELIKLLEKELQHKSNVDTIYIHPSEEDTEMFFGEHFSLSPEKLVQMVRSGFRAANEVLKNYEFEDHFEEKIILKSS